ncbi:hypothetical protein MES5069_370077 [Mesorhizobium escarrei]|uniref:Uncharacterized protein n=1 Tax=Mesorhizobium escarrei TaxID=666018 RepID=A0ABN8K1W7_9HYPH|nr:hypothetical protein MES5069_370077 [Mesorhizobium escarrei]
MLERALRVQKDAWRSNTGLPALSR